MAPLEVSAAVLIGGGSRRMGSPKALQRLHPDGPTMIEAVVSRLQEVAAELLLVGTPAWPLPNPLAALDRIPDRGVSAADGVVAALAACRHEACLIVGCDLPFLDAGLLREMAQAALREGTGVIATDHSGAHPLHAVWRRDVLGTIEALLASGERSLGTLAEQTGMIPLRVDGEGRSERERWSVFNVNTPADLAAARARSRVETRGEDVY
jgi:molybdopterin-guanine dinucleotide biosynthesis protein A